MTTPTPLTLTEICDGSGLPKSTVFRLLNLLVDEDLVQRTDYVYSPASRLARLAGAREDLLPAKLSHTITPYVGHLHHLTGLVAYLCVPCHQDVVVTAVAFHEGQGPWAPHQRARLPMHCTPGGKIILAYDNPLAERLLGRAPLAAVTRHTLTDPLALARQLRTIRAAGMAFGNQERLAAILEQAVPVYADRRLPVAALTVAQPVTAHPQVVDRLLRQVAHQASLAARRVLRE